MKSLNEFLTEATQKTIEVDWVSEVRDIRSLKDGQKDIDEFMKEFKLRGLKVVKFGGGPNGDDELRIKGSEKDLKAFIKIYSQGYGELSDYIV